MGHHRALSFGHVSIHGYFLSEVVAFPRCFGGTWIAAPWTVGACRLAELGGHAVDPSGGWCMVLLLFVAVRGWLRLCLGHGRIKKVWDPRWSSLLTLFGAMYRIDFLFTSDDTTRSALS